jgi:phage/plasmid-like protein (TIGR03299 family)
MGHEIETIDRVGLRQNQAWHGLGVVIDDDLNAVQAGERFGLFWDVQPWKLEAISPDGASRLDVSSHVANIRMADSDGNPITRLLGVVGAEYQICQNRELAEFADALAQTGKVVIESCGSIQGGKRLWFLARGESFKIGGTDKVWPYVLVSNSHDGTNAIRVTPTTIRVVCSNTLHMVIPHEDGTAPESAAIAIRHSGKIADKMEQARLALEYYQVRLAQNRELYEAMAEKRIERRQALELFASAYSCYWKVASEEDLKSNDKRTQDLAKNRNKRMDTAAQAFLARYDSDKAKLGLQDSPWLAFNAMSGYLQHEKATRGASDKVRVENRIESNLFGLNATRTQEVLAASLALAV